MKIRTKLLLIFFTISVLPILFFAFFSYISAKDSLNDAITNDLSHISEFKTREMENFFDTTRKDLLIAQGYYNIKKNLPVVSRLSGDKSNLEYILSKNQLDDQLRVLQEVKEFINIMLVDASGIIVYSSDPEHMEKLEHSTGHLSPATFEKGKEYINFGDPFDESMGLDAHRFGMLAAAPAYGLGEEWIGEIVFELNMDPVYESIQGTAGLGETGETLIGKKINDTEVLILNPLRHDKDAALKKIIPIGSPVGVGVQHAVQGVFGSGTIVDYRGVEVLADWHYIPSLDWGMVTKIDASEAFAPIKNLRSVSILVIFVEILALFFVISSASKLNWLEQKVRERTEDLRKFELAVENAYSHIVITDLDGVILYANKAAEKITGYSKKEILGQKPSLWGKQMDLEFYQNLWRTIKEDKKTFSGEVKNKRKSGEIYFADAHISPVLGDNGEVKFFVGIERDITEEKKLEKTRMDFLSLASHQLRTPLSGIKWQIETIKKGIIGRLTEKQEVYINGIYEANERMIKLVYDMLNVLKFESGSVKIKKEEITAAAVFDDLLAYIGPAAKSKGINTHGLSKNYGAIIIETDSELLQLILESFFSNAVDYSAQGGEIIFDAAEKNGDAIFSVKDFGMGIPKEEHNKIFERFYRAANAKAAKPDGTGLGLYTAMMLAEKIGGKVSFESEEGKGATFYLRVPKKVGK